MNKVILGSESENKANTKSIRKLRLNMFLDILTLTVVLPFILFIWLLSLVISQQNWEQFWEQFLAL